MKTQNYYNYCTLYDIKVVGKLPLTLNERVIEMRICKDRLLILTSLFRSFTCVEYFNKYEIKEVNYINCQESVKFNLKV